VEGLVRWVHPVRGLLAPVEFLPLAEVHGLMGALTEEVLAQAVTQASAWHRAGIELRMSVNLSASNLLDAGLPARVAELLELHALPPAALVLEVTESVLLTDPDRSLAVVGALAGLGVTVSIDDSGTGYSSLAYLRDLPVSELKLDRSFTVDLLTDARTEAIVDSTIAPAHRLGLRVVAEGVEDDATLEHLRALDCDTSQGHLHARPLPADELVAWLAGHGTPLTSGSEGPPHPGDRPRPARAGLHRVAGRHVAEPPVEDGSARVAPVHRELHDPVPAHGELPVGLGEQVGPDPLPASLRVDLDQPEPGHGAFAPRREIHRQHPDEPVRGGLAEDQRPRAPGVRGRDQAGPSPAVEPRQARDVGGQDPADGHVSAGARCRS
jgi:EAL domain-containing protein (putative c-di-GMP-specific phosphodiesterase class I)